MTEFEALEETEAKLKNQLKNISFENLLRINEENEEVKERFSRKKKHVVNHKESLEKRKSKQAYNSIINKAQLKNLHDSL